MDHSNIIHMTRHYPFDQQQQSYNTQVLYRRKYELHEYNTLRNKIDLHSKLKHPSIITIKKAYQSQKSRYFDIFLEHVRNSLQQTLKTVTLHQLLRIKQQLLNVSIFLIENNIYPIITQQILGINNKTLKYYLDIDYSTVIGSKEDLLKVKQLEIENIFKLYERVVIKNSNQGFSSFILFKNKSQATLKHLSSQLNSPRHTVRQGSRDNQHKQITRTISKFKQRPLKQHKIVEKTFPNSNTQPQILKNNPYLSMKPSYISNNNIKNKYLNNYETNEVFNINRKITQQIQQSVSYQMSPYEQVLRMQQCESQVQIIQQQTQRQPKNKNIRLQTQSAQKYKKHSTQNNRQMLYKMTFIKQQTNAKDKKQSLYHQAFGHQNDHLTKQFNILFDNNQSLFQNQSKDQPTIDFGFQNNNVHQNFKQEIKMQKQVKYNNIKPKWLGKQVFDTKQINMRVKKALQKSQEIIVNFKVNNENQ